MTGVHPSDELLMSYASGALDEAFAVVVSCHLQFCKRCVAEVRLMEEIGGSLFAELRPAETLLRQQLSHPSHPLSAASLARMPALPGNETIMPKPLERLTGLSRATIPWHDVAPGIASAAVALPPTAGDALHFLKLDAGVTLPVEQHEGEHAILVLWGGYRTEDGLVTRGDLHEIGAGAGHSFTALDGEGVTCIVATSRAAIDGHSWAI
jgi:putative transcriptional regulator